MKHHYVPQFLLKPWAETSVDGKVEVFRFDLTTLKANRRTPAHTGYEKDLYALSKESVAGLEKQSIEKKLLRLVDDKAARILKKLSKSEIKTITPVDSFGLGAINPIECRWWACFLISLQARQPDVYRQFMCDASTIFRDVLAADPQEYERLRGSDSPPNLELFVEKALPGLIDNVGAQVFSDLVTGFDEAFRIMELEWYIYDFSNLSNELLLSDCPLIAFYTSEPTRTIIALPIGPRKVFFGVGVESAEIIRNQPMRLLLERLNESSVHQSRVRLFARNQRPRRFIENRRYRRPRG